MTFSPCLFQGKLQTSHIWAVKWQCSKAHSSQICSCQRIKFQANGNCSPMHHWKSFYKVWTAVQKNGKTCSLYAKDIFYIKRVQILLREKAFSNVRIKKKKITKLTLKRLSIAKSISRRWAHSTQSLKNIKKTLNNIFKSNYHY